MAVLITVIVLYPASNAWLGGCSNQEEWKLATSALWHALFAVALCPRVAAKI
jgi:hypothetical protein